MAPLHVQSLAHLPAYMRLSDAVWTVEAAMFRSLMSVKVVLCGEGGRKVTAVACKGIFHGGDYEHFQNSDSEIREGMTDKLESQVK